MIRNLGDSQLEDIMSKIKVDIIQNSSGTSVLDVSSVNTSSVSLVSNIRTKNWKGVNLITVTGERGNPQYYKDSADTISADDDFLVIVDSGGNRWKLRHDGVINARWSGAKVDGSTDDSASVSGKLNNLEDKTISVIGDMLTSAKNIPNVNNYSISPTHVVKNSISSPIVLSDQSKNWLQHNHLEETYRTTTQEAITSGDIPPAPMFNGDKQHHTNVLAYWYQDFGLEATRAAGGGIGSLTWYYWDWLFHGASGDGYEPERHPWLGYYRGDNANVLDWQCYWLNEAGVSGVIPQSRGTGAQFGAIRATWETPSDVNHWMYQLFNNVNNFQQLTYTLWAWSAASTFDAPTQALIEGSFDEIVDIYNTYDNFSFITKNGGIYPIVYTFEGENWRGAYDNFSGSNNTRAFLAAQAVKFQNKGWSGFCLLSRNSTSEFRGDQLLEADGVIVFDAEYESTNYTASLNGGLVTPVDYEDLAIGVGVKDSAISTKARYVVPNVSTARKSHSAHPSTWSWSGSTPELFNVMCRNVLKRMSVNGSPRILTIYNVSEWAEGGPALQPNMRDGKGYLFALRDALSQHTADVGYPRAFNKQTPYFISGPTIPLALSEGSTTLPIKVSFAFSHTATPTIVGNFYDGQRVVLMLDQSSAHNGPLTLQDESSLAGTKLKLSAATIGLNRNDSVTVEYDALQDKWVQVSSVINVL